MDKIKKEKIHSNQLKNYYTNGDASGKCHKRDSNLGASQNRNFNNKRISHSVVYDCSVSNSTKYSGTNTTNKQISFTNNSMLDQMLKNYHKEIEQMPFIKNYKNFNSSERQTNLIANNTSLNFTKTYTFNFSERESMDFQNKKDEIRKLCYKEKFDFIDQDMMSKFYDIVNVKEENIKIIGLHKNNSLDYESRLIKHKFQLMTIKNETNVENVDDEEIYKEHFEDDLNIADILDEEENLTQNISQILGENNLIQPLETQAYDINFNNYLETDEYEMNFDNGVIKEESDEDKSEMNVNYDF